MVKVKESAPKIIKEEKNMNEIKCPNCGEVFQIDESNYDSIVKQIKDSEYRIVTNILIHNK